MRQKMARSKVVLSRDSAGPAGRSDRFSATLSRVCREDASARCGSEGDTASGFPVCSIRPRRPHRRSTRRSPGLVPPGPIGSGWAVAMVGNSIPMGFVLVRFLLSLAFVFATYNPTGYSLFHWITDAGASVLSLKAVVGLALLMMYYAIFRVVFAAFRLSGLIVAGLAAVLVVSELASIVVPRRSHPFWHFNVLLSQYIIRRASPTTAFKESTPAPISVIQ